MRRWSAPVSPMARRAALTRLVSVSSNTNRPAHTTRMSSSLLTTRSRCWTRYASTSKTCGSTCVITPFRQSSRRSHWSSQSSKINVIRRLREARGSFPANLARFFRTAGGWSRHYGSHPCASATVTSGRAQSWRIRRRWDSDDAYVQPQRMNSSVFVLVHPAWHGAWFWKKVARLVRKRGCRVFTPTLTGLGERSHLARPEIGLDTHVTDVVNVLEDEDLREVVLVGH